MTQTKFFVKGTKHPLACVLGKCSNFISTKGCSVEIGSKGLRGLNLFLLNFD